MNRRLLVNVLLILGTIALWGPTLRAWGGEANMNLSDTDKKLLLQIARESIEAHLTDKPMPALEAVPRSLCEARGAFVSLHRARPHPGDEDTALAYLRRAVVGGTRSRDRAPGDSFSRPGGAPHASRPGHSIPGTLLVAALQALPARQREALVLRYYAQWTDAQIAAAMGISGRAVVRQAERGISTLRGCGVLD